MLQITQLKDLNFSFLQTAPIHIAPDQWECPFCEKVSKRARNMKTHIMRHTGEKPLSCPHCDFKCITKHHLNYHLRNTHS